MADPIRQAQTLRRELDRLRRTAQRIGTTSTGRGQGLVSAREAADGIADLVKTGLQSRGIIE